MQIYDPTNGTPFSGNVVPPNRISQQAMALVSLYPLPNFGGSSRYNYQTSLVTINELNSLQLRLQKQLGNKNQVNGTFAFQNSDLNNTNLFGFTDRTRQFGFSTAVNWLHTFPNRVILHLSDTYSRQVQATTPLLRESGKRKHFRQCRHRG